MQNYSLNGLRMFEAAARHLSFTAAADELNITQAAVSQQIRRLEDQFGVVLFIREKGKLSLSVSGQELAESTRVALNGIQKSIDRITNADTEGALTITTLASFASRWLIPRLSRFQNKHPDIALHIHTSGHKVDFHKDGIDAAIRFGANEEPGLNTELVMQDALCLVASRDVAAKVDNKLARLYGQPLILDGSRLLDTNMLDLTGLATEEAIELMKLDKMKLDIRVYKQSDDVVLAALAGQGVALTRMSLCIDDLKAGRLVSVLDFKLPLTFGYSLVCPQNRMSDPKLSAFRRWLHDEVADLSNRM